MPSILLIEDNAANLELMCYLLAASGYTPKTAIDGAAGLEAARRESFDLIVCDIHMPGMDGYEVARQIKADPTRCHVPLVAVTALAMVGDREKVLAARFDDYITKPIDPEKFVQQVEAFLASEKRKPVVRQTPASLETPATPAPTLTVLVVDNDPVNLELARSILEPHGYCVLAAGRVESALELARQHHCDMILSDVCMTGETGYDFVRVVKADAQLRNIPFIFLTSTVTNEKDRAKGLALGATRFLFRPIEPAALLAEIESCLRTTGKVF
jgi:two-component system cell cycle response regulator